MKSFALLTILATMAVAQDSTSSAAAPASSTSAAAPVASSPPAKPQTTNGQCSGLSGATCQGSSWGNCCSQYGWCGTSAGHCEVGCQTDFGTCAPPTKKTPNGHCGGDDAYFCTGSMWGDCCSEYGWCGREAGHCGAGCQSTFGLCEGATTSSATPATTLLVKRRAN